MKWLAWLKKLVDLAVAARKAGLLARKNGPPGGPVQ